MSWSVVFWRSTSWSMRSKSSSSGSSGQRHVGRLRRIGGSADGLVGPEPVDQTVDELERARRPCVRTGRRRRPIGSPRRRRGTPPGSRPGLRPSCRRGASQSGSDSSGRACLRASARRTSSLSVKVRGKTSGCSRATSRTWSRAIPTTRSASPTMLGESRRLRCSDVEAVVGAARRCRGRWPARRGWRSPAECTRAGMPGSRAVAATGLRPSETDRCCRCTRSGSRWASDYWRVA